MRCLSCDKKLSTFECVRKSVTTGEYLDLCNNCYSTISDDVPTLENDVDHNETDFTTEESSTEGPTSWAYFTDDEEEDHRYDK